MEHLVTVLASMGVIKIDIYSNSQCHILIPYPQTPVDVTLAPPPDLVVSSIQSSNAFVTGRTMAIQYNVSNIGAGEPYESYWQDIAVSTSP